jgi:hypothetical protein
MIKSLKCSSKAELMMNFNFLLDEPVQKITELHPGYEEHASDVWQVKTENKEIIVRSSRMTGEPANDFWWGCKRIFGIDPRQVYELEYVNNTLNKLTSIPVPRVINKEKRLSREYIQ